MNSDKCNCVYMHTFDFPDLFAAVEVADFRADPPFLVGVLFLVGLYK